MSNEFPHSLVYHVEFYKRPQGWHWTNQQTQIPVINKDKNNVRLVQYYNIRSVLAMIIYGCTIGRIHKCVRETIQTNNEKI